VAKGNKRTVTGLKHTCQAQLMSISMKKCYASTPAHPQGRGFTTAPHRGARAQGAGRKSRAAI
jgi:hypothetical protein